MYSILNLVATQDNNFPETINGYFAYGSMKFNDTDGSKTFILPKNLVEIQPLLNILLHS